MDKLEDHITKNREDLDRYTPSAKVWEKINTQIKRDKFPLRRLISIAAIIIVILGTATLFIRYELETNFKAGNGKGLDAESENTQIKETEIYYNNMVNSLYREAIPMLTGNPEIQKELTSDFSHIDSICRDIKKDLKDNVDNQEVVEALVQNYRIKIRLLEDMLTVLKENESNHEKKKNDEL